MNAAVPWNRLVALIEPHYPTGAFMERKHGFGEMPPLTLPRVIPRAERISQKRSVPLRLVVNFALANLRETHGAVTSRDWDAAEPHRFTRASTALGHPSTGSG
jgi:hypothetical protein